MQWCFYSGMCRIVGVIIIFVLCVAYIAWQSTLRGVIYHEH